MNHIQSDETVEELIEQNPYLILQFGSDTCNPCHAISKKLDDWQQTHPNVVMRYIPLENYGEEAAQMDVFTAPTVITYIEGKILTKDSGYFGVSSILKKMEDTIALIESEQPDPSLHPEQENTL